MIPTPVPIQRIRFDITGVVQGVGFRPSVARLAQGQGLHGFVQNQAGVVRIEVEGHADALRAFETALQQLPPPCRIDHIEQLTLPPEGDRRFRIEDSTNPGAGIPTLLPDTVTCPECLAEMRDPLNRRYRYPFISCAVCGPRYSISEAQPFDRARTALGDFPMCDACAAEYRNSTDRRFHAQTITCPTCGPTLSLVTMTGKLLANRDKAIETAAARLRNGEIVGLKGLGGFQLLVDASNSDAVQRLRLRKRRPAKPLAVMVGSLDEASLHVALDSGAHTLLTDRAGAIVLLKRCGDAIAAEVAPGSPMLGVMLPSSGLHALLLDACETPLVVTSGNASGQPIAIDNEEAARDLAGIADCLLVHDRRITHRLDDSVVQLIAGKPQMLRRARGHVPLTMPFAGPRGMLACGAHQKNTVAVSLGGVAVMSQYNGDLDSVAAREQHGTASRELIGLLDAPPARVIVDANLDYASAMAGEALAATANAELVPVWHHLAHLHATASEHGVALPFTGFAWDGSGIGGGNVVRGGECFALDTNGARRVASLRQFPLPGGDRAAEEPRRAALGLLFALEGAAALEHPAIIAAFTRAERAALLTMLQGGVRCPASTSIGRLFDGVAFLLGVARECSFEGEAAMQLQFAAEAAMGAEPLPFGLARGELDWRPLLQALLEGIECGDAPATLAARFHATLAAMTVRVAQSQGLERVVLGGGCFQNRLLVELADQALRSAGFSVFWPQEVPANDGGLSFGQLAAAHMGHLVADEGPYD
ncbi:carbamoyltransferase HypF [Niveibacterium umoris]|uniref:Carbamoyltransferase HypF n=1 Tax=Niveibacterium umoris TaxID=1193620 RepID=A0A840BER7_9RHOO|nr:carbamoyltransferase HypF [Niveibacterium umoris]MBB4011635.1 hydrogenase maturation protein HypF [Niveibacterium umoris]